MKTLSNNYPEVIHEACLSAFSVFFDPLPSCPYLGDLPPPLSVRTQTLEYDAEFLKNPTPNIHICHPSHSTNTMKVSHKVKYLLTTLIQNENRERINIYLKISYRNEKNSICFKEPIYCPVWTHQRILLTFDLWGLQSTFSQEHLWVSASEVYSELQCKLDKTEF